MATAASSPFACPGLRPQFSKNYRESGWDICGPAGEAALPRLQPLSCSSETLEVSAIEEIAP